MLETGISTVTRIQGLAGVDTARAQSVLSDRDDDGQWTRCILYCNSCSSRVDTSRSIYTTIRVPSKIYEQSCE